MATDDLEWLGTWYQQQCNGKWEHQKGMLLEALSSPAPPGSLASTGETVSLGSKSRLSSRETPHGADPSGWRLRIDLRGTAAAGSSPRKLAVCTIHGAWLRCTLNAQRFEGEGAEVEAVIAVFRRWIDAQPPVLEAASAG